MLKQPNSLNCFVCGISNPVGLKLKFYIRDDGEIASEYMAPEHFQGFPGVLHGGITATILDEAAGRAHMGIEPPRFMYTARLDVKYRQSVPVQENLTIVARAGKSKGRVAESWSAIYNSKGEILAEANALLVDVPKDAINTSRVEELGWRVYPDE